jgi:hypothetical protein
VLSKTLQTRILASGAIPLIFPFAEMVPATCVPCPFPSRKLSSLHPSGVKFLPPMMLFFRSGWFISIPVSRTATTIPFPFSP